MYIKKIEKAHEMEIINSYINIKKDHNYITIQKIKNP